MNIKFAEALHDLRTNRGLTLQELGEQLGVTKQTVSRWEKSEREPNIETINKLCDYFDVPANYLLGTGLFAKWDEIFDILDTHYDVFMKYFEDLAPPLHALLSQYKDDKIKFMTILDAIVSDVTADEETRELKIYFKDFNQAP